MQDVILLVSTSAIFIFGYFLMNKLDVFLENNFEPITQNQITQIALWRDSKNHLLSIFHWMPEQICRGSVADVGFDVVCYNIENGIAFT